MMRILKRLIKFFLSFVQRLKKTFYTYKIKAVCQSYREPLRVNHYSVVNNKTILGENVNFNGMIIEGAGAVTIGDNFHSGTECKMITQTHNYEGGSIPYDRTYILKDIIIEDNVWLGDRVMILGGVVVGEGAIIQAGSVVVSDIPKCGIAGGHPEKIFKYRDKAHYYELKKKGKFV